MNAAARHRDAARCERCLYALEGLGDRGRCPECGARFQLTEPVAESIDDRKTRLHADLALRRFNGPPSIRQRLAPLLGPAAFLLLIGGAATLMIWMGWQTIQALNHKLATYDHRFSSPRPSSTGSMAALASLGDAALYALRCVPYALLALAVAAAIAGLSFRRVPIAPGTTLTGGEARGLGGFALGAAIVLAGLLYISAF